MAATNGFPGAAKAPENKAIDYSAPPYVFEAITPSDASDFTNVCRAIYVGVGGDVVAVAQSDGTAYTFRNAPSGSYIHGFFRRVNSTNTTATNLIACS